MTTESGHATAKTPDFRMADEHGYILDRGHLATARLNLQHFLWQCILSFTIRPSISPPPDPKIADVASGTAMWALDAAQENPVAELHACDLDTTQAPPLNWLPSNLHISQWDIFRGPPASMLGNYDLVHVRLLVLVLSRIDPLPAIRRFSSLKPGGWLQCEDLDCTRMHVKRTTPEVRVPALDGIIEMSKSGERHDWVVKLPEMLAAEGFVYITMKEYGDPKELCRALNDQHLMTMEEFANGLFKIGEVEPAKKALSMVKDGYQESLRGAAICYPGLCCVARKPSN